VECEDIDGLVLVFLLNAGDELIGRRAAGTAFGSKELDDGKPFGGAGQDGGWGRMEESPGCQKGYNEAAQQNGYSEGIFHNEGGFTKGTNGIAREAGKKAK
jgi:hypothetical protein